MRRLDAELASPLHSMVVDMPGLGTNTIGASNSRDVMVWHPKDVDPTGKPLIVCLASYLNTGNSLAGWRGFGENIPERCDRLYETGVMGPAVIAFIDSYNRLGGNQFVNSPVIGNWVDGLADDLVTTLEARFGCGGAGKRGLFGHSSGGYGALYNLMKRPDIWSAAASHAGDCGFDWVYRAEIPKALRVLAPYSFDAQPFLRDFWMQEKPKGDQISALMVLALSASYDPFIEGHELALRLPVDPLTCDLIEERWANWLAFDPVNLASDHLSVLAKSKFIYFDCGRSDEYNILFGTRKLSALLREADISHVFEEFDGGHGTIGPRYDVSLPQIVECLSRP